MDNTFAFSSLRTPACCVRLARAYEQATDWGARHPEMDGFV